MPSSELAGLLDAARAGRSRTLVVRGEAGVGKTALLEHLLERATGFHVARTAGIQAERELAFAGLHQLCLPWLDRVEALPGPQRAALGAAFGLSTGNVPDRFLIGLAVLSLLADVAEERPLVCVVDDAQWLDRGSVQALSFVARRLSADAIAMVFAQRERSDDLAGLPELVVEGLAPADARKLLASLLPGRIDDSVRDQIVAETGGNPLALVELPRGASIAELAGGFGLPAALPLATRIEQSYRRRIALLPFDTQRLLLVAAAEPAGDVALVWRACAQLGIDAAAAPPAEADGLLAFGNQVAFRHPLVRSAVYRAAEPGDLRAVHRALADATCAESDPDRRAWHRAHAAEGPDDEVADELERSAARAEARGGLAAAAAFLERAAELTAVPDRRAARALAAAEAHHLAGAPEEALALLHSVSAGPLDDLQRARVDLLRAQIAFVTNRGNDAPPLLLDAARRLEPLAPALARETYLDALSAAVFVGRLAQGRGMLEAAQAARSGPPASQPPCAHDLILDGLVLTLTEGHAAGVPMLKQAMDAFCSDDLPPEEARRWLWFACFVSLVVWDYEGWWVVAARHVQVARDAGALTEMPVSLASLIGAHLQAGEVAEAALLVDEIETITAATGGQLAPYGALWLAAARGRDAEVSALVADSIEGVTARGEGMGISLAHWQNAVLANGRGRYGEALAAAQAACVYPDELWSGLVLPELIEAAAREGRPELASGPLARLVEATRASGTDWALGIEARSRALLTEGDAAEVLYREAIERLSRTGMRVELARCHLLYGEWLRRRQRRLDAREELRLAHGMLAAMGIEAFAERAAHELRATGEITGSLAAETRRTLTAQEARIAQMAREGASNPEIAAQLFISPRTVEYHLAKVFSKLGIGSRRQLADALSRAASPGLGALLPALALAFASAGL